MAVGRQGCGQLTGSLLFVVVSGGEGWGQPEVALVRSLVLVRGGVLVRAESESGARGLGGVGGGVGECVARWQFQFGSNTPGHLWRVGGGF